MSNLSVNSFKDTVREANTSELISNNNDAKSFFLKPFHPLVHFYNMYITEIRWTSLTLSLAYHPTAPILFFKGHQNQDPLAHLKGLY